MANEGDVVQTDGVDALYVIEAGKRRPIPNMATFFDHDFIPAAVKFLTAAEMNAIPLGSPLRASARFGIDLDSDLEAGHFMATHGAMSTQTGRIRATTRTRTVTFFGGFRGGVIVQFADGEGMPVGSSQMHPFGVDGRWVGRSDRTDFWQEDIDPGVVGRIATVTVIHTWEPAEAKDQVDRAIAIGKPIADLIADLANIGRAGGPTGPKS
jgi:hypothetical protein